MKNLKTLKENYNFSDLNPNIPFFVRVGIYLEDHPSDGFLLGTPIGKLFFLAFFLLALLVFLESNGVI